MVESSGLLGPEEQEDEEASPVPDFVVAVAAAVVGTVVELPVGQEPVGLAFP